MPSINLLKTNYYRPQEILSPKMSTIVEFLCDEFGNNISWIYDFIFDVSRTVRGGDSISLDKIGDNIIIDDTLHDSEEDHEDRVVMRKDEFLEMLDRWEIVYSQKPDEIIITRDDSSGQISIIGKFADGREV